MCKKQVDQDDSKSVQTNNLGLVNLEANSAGDGPGVFEIVAIVLLVMCVLLTCHYCNRRFRKRRQRELHEAVTGGLNGNVGFRTVSGAARGPAPGVPMVTFSDPGSRTVVLAHPPSAPMIHLPDHLPAIPQGLSISPASLVPKGAWEQCR